jgi:hypothetical protein
MYPKDGIVIALVVLCGCETFSLRLREKRRIGMFRPKRDEMKRGGRKLHNEQVRNAYS